MEIRSEHLGYRSVSRSSSQERKKWKHNSGQEIDFKIKNGK